MSVAASSFTLSGNMRGIAAMVASQAVFIVADALFKLAADEMPPGEGLFLRALMATVILGLLAAHAGALRFRPVGRDRPALAWRSLGEVLSTFLYMIALVHLPIGNATAILQLVPLALTAAAAIFLGEQVGWRRWLATAVGLAGALIVIRPGTNDFNAWSLLALASVGAMVLRDIVTVRISPTVPTLFVAVVSSAAVALVGLGAALLETWTLPSAKASLLIGGSSLFMIGGYILIIDAMRHGEASVVSLFRYSVIVFAFAAGLLIWRETPDLWAIAGTVIVVGAGVYTFHRERIRRRDGIRQ